jgi:outer membrane protein insertion porin family
LTQASFKAGSCPNCGPINITASGAPRIGVGVGVSWRTQFGLINVDLTPFVIKQPHDQTQVFRFGFGTRF